MNNKYLGKNNNEDDFSVQINSEPLGFTVKSQQLNNFTIHITGDIRGAEYYTKIFDLLIDAGENDVVDFFIASNGGDLDGLNVMLEGIRMTDAHVRAILIGPAHSAASILALNCHDVIVTDSASMLTHNIRTGFGGKIADLEAFTNFSRKISNKLIQDTYKGFLDEDLLTAVLHGKEIWMDAEEIRERLEQRAKYFTEGLTKEENAEAERTPDVQPKERRSKSKKK